MPIRFSQVSYAYGKRTKNEVLALDGLDFVINEGEFVAIIGRTGCGKSTAAQHINALLNPHNGFVEVDECVNHSVKKLRSKKLYSVRKKIGLVFQFPEYQLFEETVEKDVAYGPKNFGAKEQESLQIAHQAILDVGLDDSFFSRSPFELSGGEKRRVAIAGILALRPKYLVIDEPTAGLDPEGTKAMMELFAKLHEGGMTIVLITHDMDLVKGYADRAIVMEKGKVAFDGKPSELFEQDVSQYSLDLPRICRFSQDLQKKGIAFSESEQASISSLAKAIASRRKMQ